jgi:hypothetical protein
VHEFQTLQNLVDNVLLVNVFKDICPNDCVEICIHEIKYEVDIAVIFSANDVLETDNVLVTGEFLQENDFTESALCIGGILKCVEVLF